jgi:hypothetical protein
MLLYENSLSSGHRSHFYSRFLANRTGCLFGARTAVKAFSLWNHTAADKKFLSESERVMRKERLVDFEPPSLIRLRMSVQQLDVSKPRWDQASYYGRLRHFIEVTSPLTLLSSASQLQDAQRLLVDYAQGKRPDLYDDPEKVWKAKQREFPARLFWRNLQTRRAVVDSSIHPGRLTS